MHTPKIIEILKESDYRLELFTQKSIELLEARITDKSIMGGGAEIELLCHLFGTR